MEVQIVQWQKVQQKSSDEEKEEEKQRIIDLMEITKQNTEADMNKNKKSRAE